MSLGDALDDAKAASVYRSGRTPHPEGPQVTWTKGTHLEVSGLPLADGQSADRALLAFLDDVMGDDAGVADALDLDRLSFSLMYSEGQTRRIAWVKCPVDRNKIRPLYIREAAAQFVEGVSKRKARRAPKAHEGDTVDRLWCVSDLQLGKQAQEFGGLARTQARMDWLLSERLPAAAKGKKVAKVHIALLGDLTEGCLGSYDNQQFTTVLNTAEQFTAAMGIVDRAIERALDLAYEVEVSAVASNHDQNSRGNGKKNATDEWDDRSFMIQDALSLAFTKNAERYHDRVTFLKPADAHVAGFEMRGTTVATTHGHQVSRSGSAVTKMNGWWGDQIASRRGAAAAAQVLVAAHHHHYYQLRDGGRLLVGTPALDGGSAYMQDGKGVWSMPGMVELEFDDHGVSAVDLHTWPEDRKRAGEMGVLVP